MVFSTWLQPHHLRVEVSMEQHYITRQQDLARQAWIPNASPAEVPGSSKKADHLPGAFISVVLNSSSLLKSVPHSLPSIFSEEGSQPFSFNSSNDEGHLFVTGSCWSIEVISGGCYLQQKIKIWVLGSPCLYTSHTHLKLKFHMQRLCILFSLLLYFLCPFPLFTPPLQFLVSS